ncbi:MAG: GspH/FimT family pseudopilin [Pseudomonadales bacterium]
MKCPGFTLLELLIALVVAGCLVWLARPSMQSLAEQTRTASRINALVALIRHARHAAVTTGRWVTVCPAEGETCLDSQDWASGIMTFSDTNRDGVRQPAEAVLAYQAALDPGERLDWRAFRRQNFLQFRVEGYTNWQNGSFRYCPASRDPRYGKVLIINIQGRTALSRDSDGDGVDEQANGEPLAC